MEPSKQSLRPGDVLVYWGTLPESKKQVPSHVAIACGGDYILHNTINSKNKFAGVVKHKAQAAAQGYLGLPGTKIEVFRLKTGHQVAEAAAKFGEAWADPLPINKGADFENAGKGSPSNAEIRAKWDPQKGHDDYKILTKQMNPWLGDLPMIEFKGGKSPYSASRLEKGQSMPTQGWSVIAAFRAVKAYVRMCQQHGLSPRHGTSCDQFVMYCYQAASLQSMLGTEAKLNSEIVDLVAKDAKRIKLYLADGDLSKDLGEDLQALKSPAFDELKAVLKRMTGSSETTGFLPQAMSSDAKTSSVQKLFDKITTEDSGFALEGTLTKAAAIETSKAEKPKSEALLIELPK